MTTEMIILNARFTRFVTMWRDIGKAIALPFTVELWSVDPNGPEADLGPDTGADYATKAEALEAYRALYKWPDAGIAEHSPGWQFAVIDGPDVHDEMCNPDERTARRWRRENARSDREWQHEIAMEAGMLGGCDAYNDAMGW